MLCLLVLIPFPNPYLVLLGLSTIVLCVLEIGRMRGCPRGMIAPGLALLVITVKFFGIETILHGIVIVGPFAALAAYFGRSWRWEVGVGSLSLLMLFLLVITFLDRPAMVMGTLAVPAISLAVGASRRYRPPAWVLLKVMVTALAVLLIFHRQDSLWLGYSSLIPGAVAIRAVGRVVLILLVPAAVGLAFLVEFLEQRRWVIASWIVVLACLAEQGVTNPTFDAAANRASIESLASRIDRRRLTFYYHPDDGQPFYLHHLDAMWASVTAGVPTVNGYSGHTPRSWHGFFKADFDPLVDIQEIMAFWEETYALTPDQVQWIGADRSALERSETKPRPSAPSPWASLSGNMAVRIDDPRPRDLRPPRELPRERRGRPQ